MKAIFVTDQKSNINYVYPAKTQEYLIQTVGCCPDCCSKEDILSKRDQFTDTEYIFSTWGMAALSEDEIREIFPALKCVFYAAGTVQYFARPFLNCGVKVFSAWAANAVPVAEYTVAQIILANSGFFKTYLLASNGNYNAAREEFSKYRGNYGADIGIIGAGMIGKLVIKMLKPYHLNVMVFDPFLPEETARELGVKKVSLQEIFSKCDVISNHLANNEQTKGMLNADLFRQMKPYATLLNTGRGAQIVEKDLQDLLEKRPDIVAVLDVTDPEPPVSGSRFYSASNCILTPHIAGSSGDEVHRMAEYMVREYQCFVENRPCQYEVTLKMLETMA